MSLQPETAYVPVALDRDAIAEKSGLLKLVIVGHVDHGKSSLIGRLFLDTGSLPAERLEEIRETCRRQSRPFELAYLMDALEEEREQNVTIDSAHSFFQGPRRKYVIIDAPGHRDFIKNMISGAANAEAAILLVDAAEGVLENTRRHAYLLRLLGISQFVVLVNKLDLVGYSKQRFEEVRAQLLEFLGQIDLEPSFILPGSAREGDNIVRRTEALSWWEGPTVLEALDSFSSLVSATHLPLRLPVQDIYRWDGKRIYVGRIESGTLSAGQLIRFSPSGRTTRVKEILRWREGKLQEAYSGQCVGITVEDPLFVERGEVISAPNQVPVSAEHVTASVFWLGPTPLTRGRSYRLRLASAEAVASLEIIHQRVDSSTLEVVEENALEVCQPEAASITLSLPHTLAVDLFRDNPILGRFVLLDGGQVAGGGIIRHASARAEDRPVRLVRLDGDTLTAADGLAADLQSEISDLEFEIAPSFLEFLATGHAAAVRLRDINQLDRLARVAYACNIALEVKRERNRIRVVLRQSDQPLDEEIVAVAEGI